jgi:hypothetical protein
MCYVRQTWYLDSKEQPRPEAQDGHSSRVEIVLFRTAK